MNQMTKLLNKIERRLGLAVLQLPEKISKDVWPEIIEEDTLSTFSRYFPHKIKILVDVNCYKDGFYFIDKDLEPGIKILGIKDVDWGSYMNCMNSGIDNRGVMLNSYGFIYDEYGIDDIALAQAGNDYISLFNLGIYPEFEHPNKVRLVSTNNAPVSRYLKFPLEIFVEHNKNLMTISPTKMEIFEQLATADVATFLYQNLKYFDQLDTAFGQLNLQLDTIQDWAGRRNDIVDQLKSSYVSAANDNQPIIITQ